MRNTAARGVKLGALALVAAVALALVAACDGGNEDAAPTRAPQTATAARTAPPATATPVGDTPTPAASKITPDPFSGRGPVFPTATPAVPGAPISFSPGDQLTEADIAARGRGEAGRGPFRGERLLIPRLDIDVPLQAVTVGADGLMPSPPSIDTAAWYDFSAFPGLGGTPGAGGNVIVAGDAGRVGVGIGPLYKIIRMVAGDYAMIRLTDGVTVCYRTEFNKIAGADIFQGVVQATPEESLTLITAGTGAGDRRVVWGRRVSCATAPTPTPTALPGHHKLRIVAENNTFTIVAGGTVPPERHTVDYSVDNRDAGGMHSIAFYDTTGRELIASEPFEGPTIAYGQFGVGPPQPPGRYTFRCSVHPEMTGSIDVQS